jgi:nucleoside-diphosphate-sugar epimerase
MLPNPSPTVLILGANGRFGAAAVEAFAAAGWHVLAQARQAPARLPAGARHVGIDLADTDALARAAVGARCLVHAINPPYTRWAAEVLPLGRAAMALAARLDATFLLPGNVYNHGAAMAPRLAEDAAQEPTTRKGRIRCELERELEARAAGGLRSVVIRAGDFYGAGTGSWFDLVVAKGLARGKLAYPGPLDRPHAWAYLPDLARAFVAVAARDDLAPFTRLHFAGDTLTGAELLDAVERAAAGLGLAPAGGRFRRAGLPWPLIRLAGLVVPQWREVAEMAYLWSTPHALDGTALRRTVGELPSTPLDAALRHALLALASAEPAVDAAPGAAARAA